MKTHSYLSSSDNIEMLSDDVKICSETSEASPQLDIICNNSVINQNITCNLHTKLWKSVLNDSTYPLSCNQVH